MIDKFDEVLMKRSIFLVFFKTYTSEDSFASKVKNLEHIVVYKLSWFVWRMILKPQKVFWFSRWRINSCDRPSVSEKQTFHPSFIRVQRICSGSTRARFVFGASFAGDLSVLKGVGIWLGSSAPTFLRLEERMVLETFYVLCELCSCPLPTPPQLNIQISGRDSRPPSQLLPFRPPMCARVMRKKMWAPRNIIIMTSDCRCKVPQKNNETSCV